MSPKRSATTQVTFPDILKKQLRNDPTRDSVTRSFANTLQNVIPGESFKEMLQLNAHIRDIEEAFQRIERELYNFDAQKFREHIGKEVRVIQLRIKWSIHHDRFKLLLEQSRRNALTASALMRQYRKAVLSPFKLEDIPDIKAELIEFKKCVEVQHEQALNSQNGFENLAKDLRQFALEIESVLVRAGGKLNIPLENAQTQLADLQKQLKSVTKKMHAMGVDCVKNLAVGAGAIAITIFTLSPITLNLAVESVIEAMGCGRDFIRSSHQAGTVRESMKKCKDEIAQLRAQDAKFKEYQHSLGGVQEEIYVLADKIDVIAKIWQSLKADMQMLEDELHFVTMGEAITSRFSAKLETARELYLSLAALLEAYGKGMTSAEPGRAHTPGEAGRKEWSDRDTKQENSNDVRKETQGDERTRPVAKKANGIGRTGKPDKFDKRGDRKQFEKDDLNSNHSSDDNSERRRDASRDASRLNGKDDRRDYWRVYRRDDRRGGRWDDRRDYSRDDHRDGRWYYSRDYSRDSRWDDRRDYLWDGRRGYSRDDRSDYRRDYSRDDRRDDRRRDYSRGDRRDDGRVYWRDDRRNYRRDSGSLRRDDKSARGDKKRVDERSDERSEKLVEKDDKSGDKRAERRGDEDGDEGRADKDDKQDDGKQNDKRGDKQDSKRAGRRNAEKGGRKDVKQGSRQDDEAESKADKAGKPESRGNKDGGRKKDEVGENAGPVRREHGKAKG